MAEILLFHHVLGRTKGIEAIGEQLRQAGHKVHLPDLFNGRVFATVDEGLAYVEKIGFETVTKRGLKIAEQLSHGLIYAGFSLGVAAAQQLAQTRPGAKGALFFHSCLPPSTFEKPWPLKLPLQIHAMKQDPFFIEDGDIDSARELVASNNHADLFLYDGKEHLFMESGINSYDDQATRLVMQRVLSFLEL